MSDNPTVPPPTTPPPVSGPAATPPPAYAAPPPSSAGALPVVYPHVKSPVLAGFLSMFPGLGHLYLGLYQRAFAFAGAFILSIGFASHRGEHFFGPLIAFIWFFAIIDAVRQAHAINRGHVTEAGFVAEPQLRRAMTGSAGLTWGIILVGLGVLWLLDRYIDIDWSFMETWGTPSALILLGLVLVISHIRRKRNENAAGVGMPPRSGT
jgi:F0F1-type ATP synthase assembly protein I